MEKSLNTKFNTYMNILEKQTKIFKTIQIGTLSHKKTPQDW